MILVLVVVAAVMLVIGRGHTVYFDNVSLEYEGTTYETPYKVVVYTGGEEVAKLYDGERGMATCIGQNLDLTLEITQEKGGEEELVSVSVPLPYNMDGIIINLSAYLEGLPAEAYLTEFCPAVVPSTEDDEEVVTGDDMMMGDF